MKKCDIHVHSDGSDGLIRIHFTRMCGVRECYSSPEEIYRLAIARGMDYVTITDHNRLDRSLYLVERIDKERCFTGCEYTVRYTETGHKLDVVCLGITQEQHNELMELRKTGLKEFMLYVKGNQIPHTLAHPAWPVELKPKLTPEVVIGWINMFNVIETINGDIERANDIAKMVVLAKLHKKNDSKPIFGTTGGGDAHVLSGIARAYTVAPHARSKEEFLEAVLNGQVYAEGEYSNLELFNNQILEGVEAYKQFEKTERKRGGYIAYAARTPIKAAYITLIPLLRHVLPALIARNLKNELEERSGSLERKCGEALLDMEYEGERIDMWHRINERKKEFEAGMKPPGYYLPPLEGIKASVIDWIRKKWDWANAEYKSEND